VVGSKFELLKWLAWYGGGWSRIVAVVSSAMRRSDWQLENVCGIFIFILGN
jgi:hypothetical protein